MREVKLACETVYTLQQFEDARLSYVPCTHDTPIFKFGHLWDTERQVTRASYGKQFNSWKLSGMQGVQLMTGKPSYRVIDGNHREYLTDIDMEARLLDRYPAHAEQIIKIYREACIGDPCIIKTKSDGRRLSAFTPLYGPKVPFTDKVKNGTDDTKTILLEFFSQMGLSRLDNRYALIEGSLLEIPSLPTQALREIREILFEIADVASQRRKSAKVVNASENPDDLEILYDADSKSEIFSNVYCQAGRRQHDSGRATVQFFRNADGSEIGHCVGCGGSWIRKKANRIPPLEEVLQREASAMQAAIKQAPLFEDRYKQSFRHFTPEEKTVIRAVLGKDPDAGWIPAGDASVPAWLAKYDKLHPMTGEFALNGQPEDIERRRVWHTQFTECKVCGKVSAPWMDRYLLTAGTYCDGCHKDYPIGSYLEYELNRKLSNAIVSESDTKYLGDDPEFTDFRLWSPQTLTILAAAMGTGKTTAIDIKIADIADQGLGFGIIAVPRISLARSLAYNLRRRDGYHAWGLWHEGAAPGGKFVGSRGAICCLPSLPSVVTAAAARPAYIAIDEIDFAYALLSLTVAQATKIKQILRKALASTGLVVAGQTESSLALEAFAQEVEAAEVQAFYKNASPSENPVTVFKYPDVEGKNSLILAGTETAIANALEDEKNVYAFCTTRREVEILEAHFQHLNPVIYDSYSKGSQRADDVLRRQRLTDAQLFLATSAANVGISILDDNAHTVQVSSLVFGSRNCENIVQQDNRDRGRHGGSIHITDYLFRLPVTPTENTQISLYHQALKTVEDDRVHLPEHSITKIAAAEALSTLADTQPETFLKYHLGEVAQKPLIFTDGIIASKTQTQRIKATKSQLLKTEREEKKLGALACLKDDRVLTSDQIRRQSNTGELLKPDRLAQELANLALLNAGWRDTENEPADVDTRDMAMALIEVSGVSIDKLDKQRRGFYAVHFPNWTALALIADREMAYTDLTEIGAGVEITSVTDDRFLGKLLKALLSKLAGETWRKKGFADAIREILNSKVIDHDGCQGKTFMASLVSGAAGSKLYRASRFLNLADDAGVINWTSQLISEWYPAGIAKRGEAYGLQIHEHYDLIIQCFQFWGAQQQHPIDPWTLNEYANVELPDPNAEAKEQAREMRKNGKEIADIAADLHVNISTVSRWCRGIDPKADLKAKARQMDEDGIKRKVIAKELGVSAKTLRRWLGKKGT